MDQKTRSVIIGAVSLVILAVISGSIVYLGRVSKGKNTGSESSNSLSTLPKISPSISPSQSSPDSGTVTEQGENKIYRGQGFSLSYPKKWGLLTCGNSANFELDPVNGNDVSNIACDFAVKPITFLVVDKLNCQGETVKVGNHQVIRSKINTNSETNYRWCLALPGKDLDISHRVSPSGSRATSKEDFSSQVEEIIRNLQTPGSGGS